MKGTMTLVLVMLIGVYGAAHAQTREQMEEAAEMEEATEDFLGLEWGAGIGVTGSFGGDAAVEKASIVDGIVRVDEEGDLRPQLFLEMHVFLGGKKANWWRDYQRQKAAYEMQKANGQAGAHPNVPELPLMGFGPFVALQSSDNKAIDALTLGVMWGFRKNHKDSASINVGIGLSFDPSVQVLGGGLKDGQPISGQSTQQTDEEAVRFKKEGRFGWVLMTSFTF